MIYENNNDSTYTFFQQVRQGINEPWSWHLSSSRILAQDELGKPLLTLTTSFQIDDMQHIAKKASNILDEHNFSRENKVLFERLTKRKLEVLKHLALGKSAIETADEMFISSLTVETHRKTIRKKLETNSFYELAKYARAFDLI